MVNDVCISNDYVKDLNFDVDLLTRSIIDLKTTINNLCCNVCVAGFSIDELVSYENELIELERMRNDKISKLNELVKLENNHGFCN